MKKLLSLILALCMLCSAVAFAASYDSPQDFTVTLTLEVGYNYDGTYEVEIPSEVSFGEAQVDADGNTYYIAETTVAVTKNETEKTVVIYIGDENNNVLTNENGAEVAFDISATASGDKASIAADDVYAGLCVENAGNGEFALTFTTEAKAAEEFEGTYTHSRTFSIKLEG